MIMTTIAPASKLSSSSSLADTTSSTPLRVVFAGTPEFAAVSLESLIAQQQALNIEIVAVYTQPDRKAGRGQKLAASAVKQVALAHDIVVEQPPTFKKSSTEGMAARQTLRSYQPDVMIVAAYGLILPAGVLTIPLMAVLIFMLRYCRAGVVQRPSIVRSWQAIVRPALPLCRWIRD